MVCSNATATIHGLLHFSQTGDAIAFTLAFATAGDASLAPPATTGIVSFDLRVEPRAALNQVQLILYSPASESIYGGGNQYSFVSLRGQLFRSWVSEQGVGRGLEPLTSLLNTFSNHSGEDAGTVGLSLCWTFPM